MNFSYDDLKPHHPSNYIKGCLFRLPLTPFFVAPAGYVTTRTRGFHGDDFYRQFKTSGPFVAAEDAEIFCGYDAYRTFTSVDLDDESSSQWDGSRTRSYVFNTETNSVTAQTTEVGRPTIGNIWPDSPTTATQGNPDNDPPDHVEITLSEPVDKGWLAGELQRWMGESDEFRKVTGSGLGTYSFIGQGATRSESDGYLAIVGGGDMIAQGTWFSGAPYGMVGDQGEMWNGKFSTWFHRVRRKNAPVLHAESCKNGSSVYSGGSNLAVGDSIYRDGYTELELSEPIGDLWMDEYSVFQMSEALDSFPMSPASGYDLNNLAQHTTYGASNELTLVSRTGKRYRVTIQRGRYEYREDGSEWVTVESHVLTTDATTLQATLSLESNADAWEVRVGRIEEEVILEGVAQWQVVVDAAPYDQYMEDYQTWQNAWYDWYIGGQIGAPPAQPTEAKNPNSFVGPDVVSPYLLLAAMKTRRGNRFGFSPLDYSEETADDRYRKRTFKKHLTPGTVEAYEGSCGLGSISGSADLEWSEEYDLQTGLLLPRVVSQWSLDINGQDWTQESYAQFDSSYFYGSTSQTQTATKLRHEGTHTWTGRFIVAFDAPDPRGKVLSSEWVKFAMIAEDGENRTAPIDFDPPASGQSMFFEGHRLTYDEEP